MPIQYGDGKAGQYAKSEAQKRFDLVLRILILGSMLISILLGTVLGFMLSSVLITHFAWARQRSAARLVLIPIGLEIVLAIVVMFAIRWMRRPLGEIARERIKWLRGGQAEGLVAWTLQRLPKEWHLFNNVEIPTCGDLDHVVIGPSGIYCLSTKSDKGIISISPNKTFQLNGQPIDYLQQAQAQTMELRDWLKVKFHETHAEPPPFVQPVLVVPFAYISCPTKQWNVWVVNENNLLETISDRPKQHDARTINACASVLRQITRRTPKEGTFSPA